MHNIQLNGEIVGQIIYDKICEFVPDSYDGTLFKTYLSKILIELQPKKPRNLYVGFISYNGGKGKRLVLKIPRFLIRKLMLDNWRAEAAKKIDCENIKPENCFIFPSPVIQQMGENITRELYSNKITVEILKGTAITNVYRNVVGNCSCMTGNDCEYTLLYEMNPDRISIIVLTLLNYSARCLLWKLDNGKMYVDRVYTNCTTLNKFILGYIKEKNWLFRETYADIYDELKVSGLNFENGNVPYMDTFRYGTVARGKLNLDSKKGSFSLEIQNGFFGETCCEGCGCPLDLEVDDYDQVCDDFYCYDCYHSRFTDCYHCEERIEIPFAFLDLNENYYCKICYNEIFTRCSDCQKEIRRVDSYDIDGEDYCEDCYSEKFVVCCDCGEAGLKAAFTRFPSSENYYCEDCWADKQTDKQTD